MNDPIEYLIIDWKRWFAWRPVKTLDNGWVWGKTIWRRPLGFSTEYRQCLEMEERE